MQGFLTYDLFTPRGMLKATLDVVRTSAGALQLLAPGRDGRVVLQELGNKLEAYDLFENVDSALGLDADDDEPLASLVAETRRLEGYRAVWATEGLGHYHAERRWERSGEPSRLLSGDGADAPPAWALTALHAGVGLSLAGRLLADTGPRSSDAEIRDVLRRYVGLCRDNSVRGYAGAAYEALGLAARSLHPHAVPAIDRELQKIDERLVAYFWHGVGRGIYFAPTNFLPLNSSPWRAVAMTRREPPHELGRLNALAGLVWAVTLVNIRQPEILEAFVTRHRDELSRGDALSNGVASAVMVWRDLTGGDAYLDCLCRHRPAASERALAELWDEGVARPCGDALHHFYPVVKANGRLGGLFRYRPLREFVAALEKGRAA
ncbi:MAG TPA: hypothetical protein VGP08_17495 [Pyrinomonadaceae bacterium]|jgi:hypothetical protein|nr:hypothetical protein [Pyrinomonadaceae bacterium]